MEPTRNATKGQKRPLKAETRVRFPQGAPKGSLPLPTGPEIATSPTPAAALLRRLAAGLYDWLILAGVLMLSSFILVVARGGEAIPPGDPGYRLFLMAQVGAYFIGFWWRGGQTPGMRTWRIRVERDDGGRLTLAGAALRFGAALLSVAALGAGFWWMLADAQARSWHDRLSGTRMTPVAAGRG